MKLLKCIAFAAGMTFAILPVNIYAQEIKASQICTRQFKAVKQRAEAGEAQFQSILAMCYGMGQGVAQDVTQAFSWHQKAAMQGNGYSCMFIASSYASGQNGFPKDDAQAFPWFECAAKSGIPEGQFQTAIRSMGGSGVTQNMDSGMDWLKKASDAGHLNAQKVYNESKKFYDRGDKDLLSKLVKVQPKQSTTPKEVAYRNIESFRTSCNDGKGDLDDCFVLGTKYRIGEGVITNEEEAVRLYRIACVAGIGVQEACTALGEMYGGKQNYEYSNYYFCLGERGSDCKHPAASKRNNVID